LADPVRHYSGFVNLLGRPNMGKSTLLNALVGERMAVITAKPQTTRHRIIAMVNGDDFQVVFSDMPGFIDTPAYKMQELMNKFVLHSFHDADIILFITDAYEPLTADDDLVARLARHDAEILLVINKCDAAETALADAREALLNELLPGKPVFRMSARTGEGVDALFRAIRQRLPEGPPYYPKDQLTDRPERFFVSEIIRGQILEQYREEIPYSCEVAIESFKEAEPGRLGPITRIEAVIYTLDDRKKSILLGKGGEAIKKLGTAARQEIEAFLDQRVFLNLTIKVKDNWRDDERALKAFGYQP
jgi:GTP-binding protein Era